MKKEIVVLPGDGIGPEITEQAVRILKTTAELYDVSIEIQEMLIGGASIDKTSIPITDEVVKRCKESDAVFLGAVGGPQWDELSYEKRPEKGLLRLRKELELFTNFRPVRGYTSLLDASTLKEDVVNGIDLMVVRELTGGIYFGQPRFIEKNKGGFRAVDTLEYSSSEIERIARIAFETALKRRRKVTSVDKANVLASSQLWRKTVGKVAGNYPEVEFENMLVDNCAMQLIRAPRQFDVILTTNMFGDILSDEASMLTGSLGMLPSASLGDGPGLFEPAHGSAPELAGKNTANPLAAIGSVALMFRYGLHMEPAADRIEKTVEQVLEKGFRTADLTLSTRSHSCSNMGDAVEEMVKDQQ
ncbi:MAG: 3-isopropylmalate dehydrogenase [bacterium]